MRSPVGLKVSMWPASSTVTMASLTLSRMACRCEAVCSRISRVGLIGHELHGAHDAAPFAVDPIVVGADRFEQRLDIQLAVPASCLRDLALEQLVQVGGRLRRLATNCGRDIA